MELKISFKQLTPKDDVKEYVSQQSEKLKKYFDGKISVNWNFGKEKLEIVAHCHLVGNHMDFFGEATSEDIFGSIDLAIEKIERQVKKHKEIVKDHHQPVNAVKEEARRS